MVRLDINEIRRKYLKKYAGNRILEGCLPLENENLYKCIEDECLKKGFAYITVETVKGRFVEIKTIPVKKVIGLRGTVFFIYDNNIIFEYNNGEKNVRVGFDVNQKEYHLKYYREPADVSKEDLVEITEQLLSQHYNDIYHVWQNHTEVDEFANELDLNLASRIRLHQVYLEFCQSQYKEKYDTENPIVNDKLDELLYNPSYFFGKKNYQKYLDEENYIVLKD